MNPWGLILLLLGVAFIVVGAKGTQDNVLSALTGENWGTTSFAGGSPTTASGGSNVGLSGNAASIASPAAIAPFIKKAS